MLEYLKLEHINKIQTSKKDQPENYIPHHAAKEDNIITKVRVGTCVPRLTGGF